MTTTLRPAGPEQRDEAGGRRRQYAICVNSRPVGQILVEATERAGLLVGRLSDLRVEASADRRRGRGTVAVLAAEEVLRQWGCRRVEVATLPEQRTGRRMAEALGYVEGNLTMVKALHAPPPTLPAGHTAEPLTEAEFDAWMVEQRRGYVDSLAGTGFSRDQAETKAELEYHRFLPQGLHTPGVVLRTLRSDGVTRGVLWLGLAGPVREGQAWVFDVEVAPEHRGHGYGRTLMRLAEAECLAAGVAELGLNVFAGNEPARGLYHSLGFGITAHHLAKPLF